MPDGTVYVGRPTKWGNRFIIRGRPGEFTVLDSERITDEPVPELWLCAVCSTKKLAAEQACREFRWALSNGVLRFTAQDVRDELRGKDIACWCPLPEPGEPDLCHGAILLEVANQ